MQIAIQLYLTILPVCKQPVRLLQLAAAAELVLPHSPALTKQEVLPEEGRQLPKAIQLIQPDSGKHTMLMEPIRGSQHRQYNYPQPKLLQREQQTQRNLRMDL